MAKIRKFAPRLAKKQARAALTADSGASDASSRTAASEPTILPGATCDVCKGHGKAAWIDGSGWKSLNDLSDEQRAQTDTGQIRVLECNACGGSGVSPRTQGEWEAMRRAADAIGAYWDSLPREERCPGCHESLPVGQAHSPRECILVLRRKVSEFELTITESTAMANAAMHRVHALYPYDDIPTEDQIAAADAVRQVGDRLEPRNAKWRAATAEDAYDHSWLGTLDDRWYVRVDPAKPYHLVWGDHDGPEYRRAACGNPFDATVAHEKTLAFPLPPARVCRRCEEPRVQERRLEEARAYPGRRAHARGHAREDGIAQVIPVQGDWQALHFHDAAQYRYELLYALPLVGWALVHDDGEDTLVGLEQRGGVIARCDEYDDFVAYLRPGDDPLDHLGMAELRWEDYHRGERTDLAPLMNMIHVKPLVAETAAPEKLRRPRKRRATPAATPSTDIPD